MSLATALVEPKGKDITRPFPKRGDVKKNIMRKLVKAVKKGVSKMAKVVGITKTPKPGKVVAVEEGLTMAVDPPTSLLVGKQDGPDENVVQPNELPNARDDGYGGVHVQMKEPMDSQVFASWLKASLPRWKQQGKNAVSIELPNTLANLVQPALQEGFCYHPAEPNHLVLVHQILKTANTPPANASHPVGIAAFVLNSKREVLVVPGNSGKFQAAGVWKLPTGVVNEGEAIWAAAEREVKEETGIETKFMEVLAFRNSPKSFFRKSDLLFVCMLQPLSTEIHKQDQEVETAKWMLIEEYAAQPSVQKNKLFNNIANICLAKADKDYAGFSQVTIHEGSGKSSDFFFDTQESELVTNLC